MKASRKNLKYLLILSALLIPILLSGFTQVPVTGVSVTRNETLSDPVQANPDNSKSAAESQTIDKNEVLQKFVDYVADGEASAIRGIYVQDVFEFPVVQQPSNQPAYVSISKDIVTEFSLAKNYGVTGLLAHNFAAGGSFFDLQTGDVVQVVFGDGSIEEYEISQMLRFQALSPDSPSSKFVDLETGNTLSASQVFKRVYTGSHHLTLQTCIQVGSEDSWGRLFVIAEPVI